MHRQEIVLQSISLHLVFAHCLLLHLVRFNLRADGRAGETKLELSAIFRAILENNQTTDSSLVLFHEKKEYAK